MQVHRLSLAAPMTITVGIGHSRMIGIVCYLEKQLPTFTIRLDADCSPRRPLLPPRLPAI
jgi:hypothetical protein